MVIQFLRCIGLAALQRGGDALRNRSPMDEYVAEIAKDALQRWKLTLLSPEDRNRELQMLTNLNLSPEYMRRQAEEVAQDVEPDEMRLALTKYLEYLIGLLRRTVTRGDHSPRANERVSLTLDQPEDLIPLLPLRLPNFTPGDQPQGLPGVVLEELLGVGGFGEVWKAKRATGPSVALKFCLGEQGARLLGHEAALNRMMRTGRHPGIVQLLHAHLESEPPCLEYEYVEGSDLASLIRSWAVSPPTDLVEQSLSLIHELTDILTFAHQMQPPIVHRDLKPSNVLLQSTIGGFALRVTDFGIGDVAATQAVRHALVTSIRAALTTGLRGAHTAYYAPPEQKLGEEASPADDVYALGVVWYQLLTGKLNREPGAGCRTALRRRDVPESVIEIILSCLKKADQRIGSAALLQDALAKAGLLPKICRNSIGMEFILMREGSFWMSRNGKNAQEQVKIAQSFYVGKYPITQSEWEDVMGYNPSWFSRTGIRRNKVREVSDEDLKHFPVEGVSWQDVKEFIDRLNQKEAHCGWRYRLPSEAEWEYCCRGGLTSETDCSFDFYFSQPTSILHSGQANFNGKYPSGTASQGPNLDRPTRVGSYIANPQGIYDLHGNVWEWCEDSHFDWSAEGENQIVRGGSWSSSGDRCRAATRERYGHTFKYGNVGFRLVRTLVD